MENEDLFEDKKFTMVEVNADLLFDSGVNFDYCFAHSSFTHSDDSFCEFMFVLDEEEEYFNECIKEMEDFGCTTEFVEVFKKYHKEGIYRILFYA